MSNVRRRKSAQTARCRPFQECQFRWEICLLSDQVHENAAQAVRQLQGRAKGKLDYSVSSLQVVEEILDEVARDKANIKPQAIETLVELIGSYILEVGYREHGGEFSWYEKGQQPVLIEGEPTFHVAIMSFDKVRGRISGDRGDNIPFFYEGFTERVKLGTPGTRAVYV
jgi:hypothetical protein